MGAFYEKLRPGPGRSALEVSAHQRTRIHEAMIEIVAESGYDAVTVRKLTRLAGVSTRTFYKHFKDTLECFLATHERLVLTSAQNIVEAQKDGRDWRQRLRLGLASLMREIASRPEAARLVLVEAYALGPDAGHLPRAWGLYKSAVRACNGRGTGAEPLPPFVVAAIVAGVTRVARARVLEGKEGELPGIVGDLVGWALSYSTQAFPESEGEWQRWVSPANATEAEGGAEGPLIGFGDERSLVLGAVAKLVATEGYAALSVPRIRTAAGVSRKSFDEHFDGVEACFLESAQLHSENAIAAACGRSSERDWPESLSASIVALCHRVGRDPVLSSLALEEILAPGRNGLCRREAQIADLADRIKGHAPPGREPMAVVTEASIAAAWQALRDCVDDGQSRALRRRHVSLITFLLMAPMTDDQPHRASPARQSARA